jgi:hypothetical protein
MLTNPNGRTLEAESTAKGEVADKNPKSLVLWPSGADHLDDRPLLYEN